MVYEANIVDIESREIYGGRVAVEEGKIADISKTGKEYDTYIMPGFIDAHIHIESSMLIPTQFARLAVRHGSVATVSDPHEIANVLGIAGVEFMIEDASKTAFKFHFGASPCVPATPFETSGAVLGADEVKELLKRDDIYFLSEVMNFPGVIAGDEDMLSKISAAKESGKPVDGHAPGLRGEGLERYIAAGIETDHEAFSYEEGLEKLQKGMKIIIREGSAAKNFDALEPLIDEWWRMMMFCSDDRHPNDLEKEHINSLVSRAISKNHNLFDVLMMACINPIEHYRLPVGRLRVGDSADFIEVEDLESFKVIKTVIDGETLYDNGRVFDTDRLEYTPNNFSAKNKEVSAFAFPCRGSVEVIEAIDHELFTQESIITLPDGKEYDIDNDILKITVVNRYRDTPPAVAHIRGFGLKRGAIASSVAHDSHNIVAVGCSDEEIAEAVNSVIDMRGGISAVNGDEKYRVPLPVAGLMSDEDGFVVAEKYDMIDRYVKESLGSILDAPFMTLSFMALLVIPELKISDRGLFDANAFHFTPACKLTSDTI